MCHSCWMSALLSAAPTVAFTTLLTHCTLYLRPVPTVLPTTFTNPSLPLVWKTSHFRNVAVKRISALVSGGGTANHLTGSPVTNWWILEMVLCSDFFSDLYFLTCKSLERLCAMGSLYTLRLFWIRHLALFWDLKITSITKTDILWYGLHEYVCWFWCNARKPCPLTPWLSLAPDMNVHYACPWLSRCVSSWSCMNW